MPIGAGLVTVHISQFFDKPVVMREMDKGTRKALGKAGGRIRITARRSIRKRKKISQPGKPPHSHMGTLRRSIFYGYDRIDEAVVIGPSAIWRQQEAGGGLRGASLLEFGGNVRRLRFLPKKRRFKIGEKGPIRILAKREIWVKLTTDAMTAKANRNYQIMIARNRRFIVAHYRPRPFMYPALMKNLSAIPEGWRGVIG